MTTVSVATTVDIDLGDLDTADLVAEIGRRGYNTAGNQIALPDELAGQRTAMLRALWANEEAKVIDLLRTYLCDCLGRACV